jgi:RND family efflux transporter MFP subunit
LATADRTPARDDQTAESPSGRADAHPVPALRQDPPASSTKRGRRRGWLWGGAALVGLALAALAYTQLWMTRPPLVPVEIAAPAPVTRVLAVNGRIAAVRSVDVRATVSGRLATLAVAEGDTVDAGQVLAEIDAAAQSAVVRQAVAALDAALVAQDQARETYDRLLALGTNVARSTLETEARAVQSAGQEVARMTAILEQARVALRDHTIRAPLAGTVLVLNVEEGQTVDPATPLMTLADLAELVVEADVDEAYATQIAPDQPAVLQLAGETGTRDGHVSFVSRRVDVDTGGLAVEIAFDAPVSAPVGLTVATNLVVERREAALTVPRTALETGADGTGVFLVQDGTARFAPVTVEDWPAARLIVTDGLAEGDVLITDAAGIADGQAVAVEQP